MKTDAHRALIAMALATLFFAAMSVCVKWAQPLHTLQIVFFRAVIALVLCLVQLRWMGISPLGTHKRLLFLRGLFGSGALIAYFWSLSSLPLATATVLQNLSPIFTAALAFFVLKERLSGWAIALFAVAAAGVVLIQGTGAGGTPTGIAIALLGAFLAACAYTTIARIGKREHPLVIVLWFPLVTVPLVTPFLASVWQWPSAKQWLALLGVGICVQIAQVFMTTAYQIGPASRVSLVGYLGVVWGGVAGLWLFDEPLTAGLLGGSALIVGAVVGVSQLRQQQKSTD